MNPLLVATIAGLLTALFWGTGDYLSARSAKKFSPIEINFAISVVDLLLAGLVIGFSGIAIPTLHQIGSIVLGSTLITAAYLVFVKALSSGVVGIIVPLANSYALVTIVLSVVFLNQIFSYVQFGAMGIIILGAAVLSYEKNTQNLTLKELHYETMLAIVAAVTWGVAFFVLNPITREISWQSLVVVAYIYSFIMALALLLLAHRRKTVAAIKRTLSRKLVLLTATVGALGGITLYIGSDYSTGIVIPAVLSSIGPLVASAWAAVLDHERIGAVKRAGAVLVVAGIVWLNLG